MTLDALLYYSVSRARALAGKGLFSMRLCIFGGRILLWRKRISLIIEAKGKSDGDSPVGEGITELL